MRIIALLLSLLALSANAAHVRINMTFTNGTATGDTFTRNGVLVTYTNTPLNSTSWIVTNSATRSATNLWNHLGANLNGRWRVAMTSPTNLDISGHDAQFSIGGTYAILTTNISGIGGSNFHPVMVGDTWTDPQKHQTYQTNRTNDASSIMQLMKLYALAEARANFFSNEIIRLSIFAGGTLSNAFATNMQSVHSMNVAASNLTAIAGQLNGVNVTNAPDVTATSGRIGTLQVFTSATMTNFSAPDVGLQSQRIGVGARAYGDYSVAYGVSAIASNQATALGYGALAHGSGSTAVGQEARALGDGSTAVGQEAFANKPASSALGNNASAIHTNSTAIGANAVTTTNNQVRIGTASEAASIPGELQSDGTAKFSSIVRTRISGSIRTDEGAYSSLTGFSNNVVQLATNPVTRLSGATGNYNVNSLRFADGIEAANRWAEIINDTAYTATIIESALDGFETQATNRIRSGVNLTLAAGAGAKLKYSTSYSRWELMYPSPLAQFTISGTTNQLVFGGSNNPPANTATVRKWISGQIMGESNAYRIALFE